MKKLEGIWREAKSRNTPIRSGKSKVQLERLKMEIRKNFLEGQKEKEESAAKIKEEGMKENPDYLASFVYFFSNHQIQNNPTRRTAVEAQLINRFIFSYLHL